MPFRTITTFTGCPRSPTIPSVPETVKLAVGDNVDPLMP
jgi:hypothetical protein